MSSLSFNGDEPRVFQEVLLTETSSSMLLSSTLLGQVARPNHVNSWWNINVTDFRAGNIPHTVVVTVLRPLF